MAVDVCSEISSPVLISPRISFSHDLKEKDFISNVESSNGIKSDDFLLNSTINDFVFSIDQTFSQHLSSADEIFANGKILPIGITKNVGNKNKTHDESQPILDHSPPPMINVPNTKENTKKNKRLIEFLYADHKEEKPLPKPFWQLGRSSSLNCTHENYTRSNGFLRSLQSLTRSNSTGSAPNQKVKPLPKAMEKQRSLKEASFLQKDSVVCAYNNNNNNNTWKMPNLKKSTSSRSYGNGVRFSPVLNIPPTYNIAKGTASLFGIGSFFCNKKSKKKKK